MYYPYYGKITHVSKGSDVLVALLPLLGKELLQRVQMHSLAISGSCRQEGGHGHWDCSALFLSLTNCRESLGTLVFPCQQWEQLLFLPGVQDWLC